ncbi:signal recognition particle protein Srp54 [Planctomycetes bacterium Pan216]|uniref:Signal recognition particle protein Srp54 n=1 Tax=Kolteria novifilia TaxID=2527975 RepID=A0A518B466_9BACT|nr:signal recognition particle protein Srp54 [Planctomycetes bacterium Pan216]
MASVRFIMVGGFLGAGKTTTIARLAATYQSQGLSVGIVTNDQASDLVDTHMLRSLGHEVGEVPGACFCCNFDELMETVDRLGKEERPDVILAEPVGSCTDLAATVIQPLAKLYDERFSIAPYTVILKPSHGRRILRGSSKGGFSPKAEYIFLKQLEEADGILVNRIDELDPAEVDELAALVEERHCGIPILRISALSGQGFDGLTEFLSQKGDFGRRILDLDYDVYAEGEAELGWLNSSVTVRAKNDFDLDDLLMDVIGKLRLRLAEQGAETAHLKTIGLWEGFYGVANLVSSDTDPKLSLPSRCQAKEADIIVNARVAIDPTQLEELVRQAVLSSCSRIEASPDFRRTQSFRPGRPIPTHRFSEV